MFGRAPPEIKPELPLANSYWVKPGQLLAGEHPFGEDPIDAHNRLGRLFEAGVDCFIDLTEAEERPNYRRLLSRSCEYYRHPITDQSIPREGAVMASIQNRLRERLDAGRKLYVHCRAGIGRTGTVIGCFLVEEGLQGKAAVRELNRLWQQSARSSSWPTVPQTEEQAEYIRAWSPRVSQTSR
jgi:hypothetical protein